MKKPIKENSKEIKVSVVAAAIITLIYFILVFVGIIKIECTIPYLNPWQHSLSCLLFRAQTGILVFIAGFLSFFITIKAMDPKV